jgi:hypothetical protein
MLLPRPLPAKIGESTDQIRSLALPLNPTRAYLLAIPTITCALTLDQLSKLTGKDTPMPRSAIFSASAK